MLLSQHGLCLQPASPHSILVNTVYHRMGMTIADRQQATWEGGDEIVQAAGFDVNLFSGTQLQQDSSCRQHIRQCEAMLSSC